MSHLWSGPVSPASRQRASCSWNWSTKLTKYLQQIHGSVIVLWKQFTKSRTRGWVEPIRIETIMIELFFPNLIHVTLLPDSLYRINVIWYFTVFWNSKNGPHSRTVDRSIDSTVLFACSYSNWHVIKSYFICDLGTGKQLTLGVADSVLNNLSKQFPLHLGPTVWLFPNRIWNNCTSFLGSKLNVCVIWYCLCLLCSYIKQYNMYVICKRL